VEDGAGTGKGSGGVRGRRMRECSSSDFQNQNKGTKMPEKKSEIKNREMVKEGSTLG
jgi:hypothetical protein